MKEKIEKRFFVFQVIPSDFAALYGLYQARIVPIGTQSFRKQF